MLAVIVAWLASERSQLHWQSTAEGVPVILGLLLAAGLVLPMIWLCFWLAWLQVRYRKQVLEVTPAGLSWRDGEQRQFIPWSGVTQYGYRRERGFGVLRYVLGGAGEVVLFQPFLPRGPQLQGMIQRLAAHSRNQVWQFSEPEHLGGSRLGTRDGARVFHYRTRTNRAMLCFGGTYAAVIWLPLVRMGLGIWPADAGQTPFAALALALITDAAFLWVVLCYYRSAVLVDERGLTRETPLGRKRLDWTEVREVGQRASWPGKRWYVRGQGVEIRFESQITDLEELQREITARAPQAEGAWPAPAESLPVTTR